MIYMLTPKRKKTKRSSKRSIIIALTLLPALLIIAWWQEKQTIPLLANQQSNISYNVEQLWNWSNQLHMSDHNEGSVYQQWSIRWDAHLRAGGIEQLSAYFFKDAAGNHLPKVISQQGNRIEGSTETGQFILHKMENEMGEQKAVILFEVDSSQLLNKRQLQGYIEGVHRLITELDKQASVSIKVRAELSEDRVEDNYITKISSSTIVDEYKDNSMKVLTLHTPMIRDSLTLDTQKNVNLQYAVYEDEMKGKYIFTLGTPLISGEFGETVSYSQTD